MVITFLIGNGFDLHMGMKTRYVDVYDGYIKSKSKNKVIEEFKELLKEDAPNEYTNWSDFEQKMGECTDKFKTEQEFVDCVRDFKEYLANHLANEEKAFLHRITPEMKHSISKEMYSSLTSFYHSLSYKDIALINKSIDGIYTYNFITFNYTTVLDELLLTLHKDSIGIELRNMKRPFYLHGKTDTGIVLGVDNLEQLNNRCSYSFSRKLSRAFIKPFFNELYDPNKVNTISNIIKNSSVICVYGLSLGKSDLTWVNIIIDWLKSDKNHHLVYYKHSNEEYNLWHKDLVMDIEDEYKDELLKQINYSNDDSINELFEQVHIPVGFDIFNVEEIIEKAEKLSESIKKGEKAVDESLTKLGTAMIPKENAFN